MTKRKAKRDYRMLLEIFAIFSVLGVLFAFINLKNFNLLSFGQTSNIRCLYKPASYNLCKQTCGKNCTLCPGGGGYYCKNFSSILNTCKNPSYVLPKSCEIRCKDKTMECAPCYIGSTRKYECVKKTSGVSSKSSDNASANPDDCNPNKHICLDNSNNSVILNNSTKCFSPKRTVCCKGDSIPDITQKECIAIDSAIQIVCKTPGGCDEVAGNSDNFFNDSNATYQKCGIYKGSGMVRSILKQGTNKQVVYCCQEGFFYKYSMGDISPVCRKIN